MNDFCCHGFRRIFVVLAAILLLAGQRHFRNLNELDMIKVIRIILKFGEAVDTTHSKVPHNFVMRK